jgi:PKD repeat protein
MVTIGASATLTLTISAGQANNTTVALSTSPPGIVSIPGQVVVPAGQTTVPVQVGTLALGQGGITASLNGTTASAIVNVAAPPVAVTALAPATFAMNVRATGSFTVSINAAQLTDTPIALSVDNAQALQIPPSVTIAQGTTSAVFTATGLATGNAVITASANGTSQSSSVHVSPQPAAIVSLLPNPLPLQEGATGSLTVTLNVAQEVDTTIALSSDTTSVATVAGTVIVPAGALSAVASVNAVSSGSANVTATVNSTSGTSQIVVTAPPPDVTGITPGVIRLPQGLPGTLRVTVSHAPTVATAVTLSSSAPTVASVPGTVNIPAGALFADFPVASNGFGFSTITATLGNGSASATVFVNPPEVATINITPLNPTKYVGESLAFRATGVLTDGSTSDFTRALPWASSNTAVASIGLFNGIAFAFQAGTTTISMSTTFTTAVDGSTKTVTGTSQLTVKQPVTLVLSAPATTLVENNTTTVTIFSSDPAPANGLIVSVSASGAGSGTFPAAVTIPAGGTSATFSLTAVTQGDLTLTAFATERNPGAITFTILPAVRVTAISPTNGPVGTVVGLTGTSFDPVPAINQVSFPGVAGPVPASVLTASSKLLTVAVPAGAISGPITVTNTRGTATSPPFAITGAGTVPLVGLSVASPANGASIASDKVAVTGTVQGPLNSGVTVNGITATITGNTFFAGNVPLQLGANTITVTAISIDGQTQTQSISVTSTGPAPIQVSADVVQGVAPLTVTFTVSDTTAVPLLVVQADFTSSGNISFLSPGSPISNTYATPGTYQPKFTVIDNNGASVQQTITIVVQDLAQVDQMLQATWTGFMGALASGNASQASQYFNAAAQPRYQPALQALAANLPQIALGFSPLQPMSLSANVGEYAINRTIDSVDGLFLIYFTHDADGVWRLDSM